MDSRPDQGHKNYSKDLGINTLFDFFFCHAHFLEYFESALVLISFGYLFIIHDQDHSQQDAQEEKPCIHGIKAHLPYAHTLYRSFGKSRVLVSQVLEADSDFKKLKAMKLAKAAQKVEDGIEEALTNGSAQRITADDLPLWVLFPQFLDT